MLYLSVLVVREDMRMVAGEAATKSYKLNDGCIRLH